MKKNPAILWTLLALAVLPVTLTFLFSGGDDGNPGTDAVCDGDAPDGLQARAVGEAASDGSAVTPAASAKAPVFKGFEHHRYQQFDALIEKYVDDFNRRTAAWAAATPEQAARIPKLTAAQVKAHMIQETGGGDVRSRAAWAKDPLQANVPGDWNPYKKHLGLKEPRKRNEGSPEKNLKAGIMLLARKGFGVAGQPASNNPKGDFDGWQTALRRYNGRSDKSADGRPYREAYADRILTRAKKGAKTEVEIPIPAKKRK